MPFHTLTKNGYNIKKSNISNDQYNQILQDLTVTFEDDDYNKNKKEYYLYVEKKDRIIVPKYYGIRYFGLPRSYIRVNNETKRDFNFTGTLRPLQEEVVNTVIQKLKKDNLTEKKGGGGILQLHTGFGKTVIALYIAAVLKLKTLVVVHKSFLQDQWYERIKQYTDASIGTIRQKTVDVEDKDIVIGMVQSISQIDYDPQIFKDFQLVIYDETHHMASSCFCKSMKKIRPLYTLGLSATPNRKDGLTYVIKWFIGKVLIKAEKKLDDNVYVKSFNYTTKNNLFIPKNKWLRGKKRPDTVKMIGNIINIDNRNKFITNVIDILRKEEDRKILVLSERLKHLDTLKSMIDTILEKEIMNNWAVVDQYRSSYYIGGMKDYELDDASEANIIYATYDMAQEALDIKALNTLVMASPKKDVVQSIGRIMRKPIQIGDVNPLIIDIMDNLSVFKTWSIKRYNYYESKSYNIVNYTVNETCLIPIYKQLNIPKGRLVDPEFDIRKYYIIKKYGKEQYEFEKESDFYSYPIEMFDSNLNLKNILNLSLNSSESKAITEITHDPE